MSHTFTQFPTYTQKYYRYSWLRLRGVSLPYSSMSPVRLFEDSLQNMPVGGQCNSSECLNHLNFVHLAEIKQDFYVVILFCFKC